MTCIKRNVLNEILGSRLVETQIADLSCNEINRIRETLKVELQLDVSIKEFTNVSDENLSAFVANRLETQSGRNILDIYEIVRKIAKEELHPAIDFHWFSRWDDFDEVGNYFTRPDSLDFVEVVVRIEEEFGFKINDEDAENLKTVRETIQFIWKKLHPQTPGAIPTNDPVLFTLG